MKILRNPREQGPCVLVLGMFDGVHRGHQALLMAGRELADQLRQPLFVSTFEPHPLAVLRPEQQPPLLTTPSERAQRMAGFGVDAFCIESFTRDVAAQSPDAFLRRLTADYRPAAVVCGYDYSFGDRGAGRADDLRAWGNANGIPVRVIDEVRIDGEEVSSTHIRALLALGDMPAAARLMANPYSMIGHVAPPRAIRRTDGVRTANVVMEPRKAVPAAGVYVCCLTTRDGDGYHAVVNVPFGAADGTAVFQAHVLDAWLNLAGKRVRLTFLKKLRDERHFACPTEATACILQDAECARVYFRSLK